MVSISLLPVKNKPCKNWNDDMSIEEKIKMMEKNLIYQLQTMVNKSYLFSHLTPYLKTKYLTSAGSTFSAVLLEIDFVQRSTLSENLVRKILIMVKSSSS